MTKATTLVGLDVHARQTHAAMLDAATGELTVSELRMPPEELLYFLQRLRQPLRAVYEAGPTGFGLARAACERGIEVRATWRGCARAGLEEACSHATFVDYLAAVELPRSPALGRGRAPLPPPTAPRRHARTPSAGPRRARRRDRLALPATSAPTLAAPLRTAPQARRRRRRRLRTRARRLSLGGSHACLGTAARSRPRGAAGRAHEQREGPAPSREGPAPSPEARDLTTGSRRVAGGARFQTASRDDYRVLR